MKHALLRVNGLSVAIKTLIICFISLTLANKREMILPLDLELSDLVTFTVKNIEFTIDKHIACQSQTLKTLMENEKEEKTFQMNELEPKQFELAIDYLYHPEKAIRQWTLNRIPQLVYTANYLMIDSMLKHLLQKVCQNVNIQSANELEILFSKIPESLSTTLLHCASGIPPLDWNFRESALQNRTAFIHHCSLGNDYEMVDLRIILNPSVDCAKYVKRNHLHLVFYPGLTLDYDNFKDYDASAHLFKTMYLKISLHGLCNALSQSSRVIDGQRLENPLLYCINDSTQHSSLKRMVLEKRAEFQTACHLDSDFKMDHLFIMNPTSECLELIKQNEISRVISPNFRLEFNNLQDFTASSDILRTLDMNICLTLKDNVNVSLLFPSLANVPSLTHLFMARFSLDMSQFPELPKLRHLAIESCQLSQMPLFMKKYFPQLAILDLGANDIQEIGKIESMPMLQRLYLNNNELRSVSEFLKSDLMELRELSLHSNQLESFEKIDSMPKLRELNLYHNQLSNVCGLLTSPLQQLISLSLERNQIQLVSKIESMPKLEELNLSRNHLKNVTEFFSSRLPELQKLSLGNNEIVHIDMIHSMPNLRELRLDNNHLKDISGLMMSHLPKLRRIVLYNNDFSNIDQIDRQMSHIMNK